MLLAAVFAIVGALVVDGTGAGPRVQTVVIDGDRILSVGGEPPQGATIVNADGLTLTPGFFDLHTHLSYSPSAVVRGDWGKNLKAYLLAGVTSVADFGTYPETFEPMRRLLRSGVVEGPRIHLAARITTPLGHGAEGGRGDFFSLEVMTPREARAAVKRWLAYQPDAIKVFTDGWRYGTEPEMTSMEEPTLRAIVEEAHAAHVEVLTHTVTLERARQAARAGVDVIAHGIGDADADAATAALLRSQNVTYVSTLATYERRRPPVLPTLGDLIEAPVRTNLERLLKTPRTIPPNIQERWKHLLANVGIMKNGGVRVAVGTDAGVPGTYHGYSTLREMQLLVEAGMTPLEAITAATGASAAAIRVDQERGSIVPGKLADLVLLGGAPLTNIADIEKVERVWLGGRELDRAKLKAAIAASGPTPIPAVNAQTLIDDMEHDRTALDTYRVFSTDSGLDHSTLMFQRIARPSGGHALALQARMAEKAKPWTQLWIPLTRGAVEPMDASRFQTLQLEIRGEGPARVLFDRQSLRGYNFPAQTIDATPEWRTVSVPLPANPGDLNAIGIELARPAGQITWLELDNLRFQ